MRISANPRSPHHVGKLGLNPLAIRVSVDGRDLGGKCVEASEEEGFADVYVTDDDGAIIIDRDETGAYPRVERLHGDVKITIAPSV